MNLKKSVSLAVLGIGSLFFANQVDIAPEAEVVEAGYTCCPQAFAACIVNAIEVLPGYMRTSAPGPCQ